MQRLFDQKEIGTEIAYVMVNCESGMEPKVMEELGTIDGVKEIMYTFGSYDIVTKIEASTIDTIREVITLRIRRIDNVRSTTTLMCKDTSTTH